MSLLMRVGLLGLPLLNMILNQFGWGLADLTLGKDGRAYPGDFCLWRFREANAAITAGDIVVYENAIGAENKVVIRPSNTAIPGGVALDDAAGAGVMIRVAQKGQVDITYTGVNRPVRSDLIYAANVAANFHTAVQGWGNFQLGLSTVHAGNAYAAGWVRVDLNINMM